MSVSKAAFRKNGHGLWALDEQAQEVMRSIKDGKDVMVTVRASRNPAHHRLFFAMLQKVIDAGAWEYDIDSLLDWCKFKVGHVSVMEVAGKRYVTPKSIAFESMPQDKFQRFYERAVFHICNELAGPDLAAELAQIADGPHAESERAA